MKTTTDIERVQRMTSKGQITLPSSWRKAVGTRNVVVRARGRVLTVHPARLEEAEDGTSWTVLFDKDRDNNGKGVPAEEFVRILRKHKKQDEEIRKATAKAKRKK